jgi:drug/metabolite transporter (DMT)-like permease
MLRGVLLLAVLSFFWGLGWPAMKIVLGEVRPWTFRAICLLAGGAGLLALARAGGAGLRVPAQDLKPLVITALINITGWHILSAHGIARMQAGRAAIIAYTMPLWAILLSRFLLGERISLRKTSALVFGFGGLLLLLWPDIQKVGAAPSGAVLMLGAAACWGAGTVLVKFYRWHMPGSLVMGWQLLIGGIPIAAGTFLLEPITAVAAISAKALLTFIFVVLFPIIFCHWAFFTVIQVFPAHVAALGTLSIPVIGVFSSALLLGERLTASELAALLLVVISLGLTSLGRKNA